MSEPATLADLVAISVTGVLLAIDQVDGSQQSDPGAIAEMLSEAGWTTERISALRDQRRNAGLGWPMMVPASQRAGVGAAQLHAVVQSVLDHLGVVPQVRVRDSSLPEGPRERALMAERPPHHGSVG